MWNFTSVDSRYWTIESYTKWLRKHQIFLKWQITWYENETEANISKSSLNCSSVGDFSLGIPWDDRIPHSLCGALRTMVPIMSYVNYISLILLASDYVCAVPCCFMIYDSKYVIIHQPALDNMRKHILVSLIPPANKLFSEVISRTPTF